MHARLQTWFPFTIHVCLNGREWLARQMDRAGIGYERRDNCFVRIADVEGAQTLMNEQWRTNWARLLQDLVAKFHPVHQDIVGELAETGFRRHCYPARGMVHACVAMLRPSEHAHASVCMAPGATHKGWRYIGNRGAILVNELSTPIAGVLKGSR